MSAEFVPAQIIPGSKLLSREGLLSGDNGSHDTNRTTYYDPRNGSPSACGSPLMDACHPKAMFQIVVRARLSLDVIAMKETVGEVVGDLTKMLNSPRVAQRDASKRTMDGKVTSLAILTTSFASWSGGRSSALGDHL
jgi:hypothetical protein